MDKRRNTWVIIRINHPKQGSYTVLSVYEKQDEAVSSWKKLSGQDDVGMRPGTASEKPGDVCKMTRDDQPEALGLLETQDLPEALGFSLTLDLPEALDPLGTLDLPKALDPLGTQDLPKAHGLPRTSKRLIALFPHGIKDLPKALAANRKIVFIGKHSDRIIETVSRHQLIYSIVGLILGLVSILGGIGLFLAGVTGKISWTTNIQGATSELLDAAPGAVLFIVGVFIVFITRYGFKSSRDSK